MREATSTAEGGGSTPGTYVLHVELARPRVLKVGHLGRCRFPPGVYLYVGSALGGLDARLQRHVRGGRPHWHIDTLLDAARLVGAWTVASTVRLECQIAQTLGSYLDMPVARFGASDCRCPGHLFYASGPPNVGRMLRASLHVRVEYRDLRQDSRGRPHRPFPGGGSTEGHG